MSEYKIAKTWAIFIYIFTPILLGLSVWMLTLPFVKGGPIDWTTFWILAPIAIGLIALMVFGLIETIKGKFVIDENKIVSISSFSYRELLLNEIKGYRIGEKYIIIESNNEEKKNIKVSTYFGKIKEIKEWLRNNFDDLNLIQVIQETEEILSNEEFGLTTDQREEKLSKARLTAKVLNWAGCTIAAWTLFFPNPYNYAIIVSIAFPILCLVVLKYFKGLIRVDERSDTAYPTTAWAILATSIGLGLRAMLDYSIFNYSNVWTPTILIAMLYVAFLVVGNKEFLFDKAKGYLTIGSLAIIMCAYSYGAVVTLNCMYDTSKPETFNATVLSKRISTGKHITYYLELSPWGYQKEIEEVSVTKELYDKRNAKSKVNIYFMKGQFSIPWFEVTE